MYEESITDKPKYIREDYLSFYKEECEYGETNDYCYRKYLGTGIKKENHPLRDDVPFKECVNCKSPNVLIIYAHHHIHRHSGDINWSYELYCEDCRKFTNCFFNEAV